MSTASGKFQIEMENEVHGLYIGSLFDRERLLQVGRLIHLE
jgi:hypothetical protein